MHTKRVSLLVVAILGLVLVNTGCVTGDRASRDTDRTTYRNTVQQSGDVPYATGGVGVDNRKEMRALAHQYNLQLVFSQRPRRAYIATVDVKIMDEHGRLLLEAPSNGPWFFARVPSGKYRVLATTDGKTIEKTVRVRSAPARVNFTWS